MKITLNTSQLPPSLRQIVEGAYGKKENAKRLPAFEQGREAYVRDACVILGVAYDPEKEDPMIVRAFESITNDLIAFLMSGVVVRDRKEKADAKPD